MENARVRDMEGQRCRPDVVAIRHRQAWEKGT